MADFLHVHSIVMEKFALAGVSGECTPAPVSLYYHHLLTTKLHCTLLLRGRTLRLFHLYPYMCSVVAGRSVGTLQLRGLHSPFFVSTPICTLWFQGAVYSPAERADTLPVFHLYPLYVLCGCRVNTRTVARRRQTTCPSAPTTQVRQILDPHPEFSNVKIILHQ